jgi:hypothetical protein
MKQDLRIGVGGRWRALESFFIERLLRTPNKREFITIMLITSGNLKTFYRLGSISVVTASHRALSSRCRTELFLTDRCPEMRICKALDLGEELRIIGGDGIRFSSWVHPRGNNIKGMMLCDTTSVHSSENRDRLGHETNFHVFKIDRFSQWFYRNG